MLLRKQLPTALLLWLCKLAAGCDAEARNIGLQALIFRLSGNAELAHHRNNLGDTKASADRGLVRNNNVKGCSKRRRRRWESEVKARQPCLR